MDVRFLKVDRTALSFTTLDRKDEEDDRFWHSKSPAQRMAALEQLRQIVYGYDPATERLQRVLELTERE